MAEPPGPEWMIWAGNLKYRHEELCHQIQQHTDATTANSEAIAQSDEKIKDVNLRHEDLRLSHSTLHDKTSGLPKDVQLLTRKVDDMQQFCEMKHQTCNRRLTKVEQLQEGLLGRVEHCHSQIEAAVERQPHVTPEREQQPTHDLTGLKQHVNRQSALEKEVNEMRKEVRALRSALQSEGRLQVNASGKCYSNNFCRSSPSFIERCIFSQVNPCNRRSQPALPHKPYLKGSSRSSRSS